LGSLQRSQEGIRHRPGAEQARDQHVAGKAEQAGDRIVAAPTISGIAGEAGGWRPVLCSRLHQALVSRNDLGWLSSGLIGRCPLALRKPVSSSAA
jgi:hypothetical protein